MLFFQTSVTKIIITNINYNLNINNFQSGFKKVIRFYLMENLWSVDLSWRYSTLSPKTGQIWFLIKKNSIFREFPGIKIFNPDYDPRVSGIFGIF